MTEHYYSKNPSSEMKIKKIKAILRGNELEFYTASGTFSLNSVDKGSEILINYCDIDETGKEKYNKNIGKRILDLGCGYGPAGIAIAKTFPECEVVMTDINERAVKMAGKNSRLNGIENTKIVSGNMYESVDGEFDVILLNPPQSAGRKLCFEMIEKSVDFLNKGGSLQIIARKNKGGEVLGKKMEEIFGNLDVLAKKSGYWLYISKKLN